MPSENAVPVKFCWQNESLSRTEAEGDSSHGGGGAASQQPFSNPIFPINEFLFLSSHPTGPYGYRFFAFGESKYGCLAQNLGRKLIDKKLKLQK